MAGDVIIHRAYFGAGDIEDLQRRVAHLWHVQQEGVVDAEVVGVNDPVTLWHRRLVEDFIAWAGMEAKTPAVPRVAKSDVLRWLESHGPNPRPAEDPPF